MPTRLSRRRALQIGGAAVAFGIVSPAFADEVRAAAPAAPGSLHRYAAYGWLRGFSVVPSWGARIEEAWSAYHPDRFREEIALARQVHANCIRLWIEFTAWFPDPERVTARFLDAVKACGEIGLTAMPCLFNRWHDTKYDYGGTHVENLFGELGPKLEYVRAVVKPLIDDPTVLIWDLCNEPQAHDLNSDVNRREHAWLEAVAATVRELGAKQPVTIGTMNGGNITTYAPLCDVLCAHPYVHTSEELAVLVKGYIALREQLKKPMLVNETIPGALDDAVRAGVARFYTEQLSAAGLGWMGWALREGKAISTRRDRFDGNGINGQGFHPWFTADGKPRGGLEFLMAEPSARAPWRQ